MPNNMLKKTTTHNLFPFCLYMGSLPYAYMPCFDYFFIIIINITYLFIGKL